MNLSLNYRSLPASLDYLKKKCRSGFNVDQKTVTVRLNQKAMAAIRENNAIQSAVSLNPIKDTVKSREKNIDEVVLVGYGKQSKKNNSGSISSIDEKQMKGVHPVISEILSQERQRGFRLPRPMQRREVRHQSEYGGSGR